jgi:hypothetical protein
MSPDLTGSRMPPTERACSDATGTSEPPLMPIGTSRCGTLPSRAVVVFSSQ